MSLNRAVITPAESQVILSAEADWMALTDDEQEQHISIGSVYIQTKWTCLEVDWDDDTTISDEIKEACAYYSLADLRGTLYESSVSDDSTGKIVEESKAVGSLKSTTKWADNNTTKHYTQYPDGLMSIECTKVGGSGSVVAVRC